MLGSKGDSEGRSIRGFNSGAGFGDVGVVGQGKGGPCLGNVPPEGDFLIEGSLFGAISVPLNAFFLRLSCFAENQKKCSVRRPAFVSSDSRKIRKEMRKDGK